MIIGVSAKKQGGKSTMVSVLHELLPDSQVMRFADFLKEIVLTCFVPVEWNWTIEDLDPDENKNRMTPCGWTVRKLLQTIGTDWFRHTYQDCWITAFKKKVSQVTCSHILVPDVRFPNELRAIQEMGGKVIRLLRAPFQDQDQHESETALDQVVYDTMHVMDDSSVGHRLLKFDCICDNTNMTMEEQAKWTKDWVEGILGKKALQKRQ